MASTTTTITKQVHILDPEQLDVVERSIDLETNLGGVLNASDTGQGKTSTTAATIGALKAKTALIIAPINTFDGWVREINARTDLEPKQIDSTDKGQEHFAQLARGVPGAYYVGREFFSLSATSLEPNEAKGTKGREALWSWRRVNKHLDVAVLDEGHSMSNRWSKGYSVLKTVKPKLLKVYLSATPFRANFARAWAPTRWLWPDLIDRSQHRWGAQWAEYGYNPHKGGHNKMEIVGEKNPGAFVQSLPCYVRLTYEKKPVELHKVRSRLTPSQQTQYEQMLKNSFAWLDENPLVAELPITQLVRLRQMLLGEVTFNEDGEVDFAPDTNSDKIRQCIKIATDLHPDDSILFFVDSKKFAKVLAQRLTQNNQPAIAWTGDLTKKKREEAKARFLASASNTKHIVAVPAAIGEGSDGLQHRTNIEVWVNRPFDSVINLQAEGRLNRRGQDHSEIIRYQLIVPDTVDDDDIARDLRKTQALYASINN